jgi:hypothetical protein
MFFLTHEKNIHARQKIPNPELPRWMMTVVSDYSFAGTLHISDVARTHET